jgi:hypothetical protein
MDQFRRLFSRSPGAHATAKTEADGSDSYSQYNKILGPEVLYEGNGDIIVE